MNFQSNWVPALKKREILKALTLTIILFSAVWMFNLPYSHASRTILVPQDYPTIGEATSHASTGDTIQVQSGIYNENVKIDKPLTLQGQNKTNTVIEGNGGSNPTSVLTLAANNVRVSGLTIKSQSYSNTSRYAYGIWVEGDNCTISDNIIQNTYIGIWGSNPSSTTITQNTITGNIKDGIRFFGGSQNTISDNNITKNAVSGIALNGYLNIITNNSITNNFRGIGLGASYSVLFGNNIESNNESGIFLDGSQNVIAENNVASNKYGVYVTLQLTGPTGNRIFHNNFADNYVNAFDNSSGLIEVWDNGSQGGGNFWSDYQSTPYIINSNNQDNYPLTDPFNTSNPGNLPIVNAPSPKPNSIIAFWSFDSVDAGLVTPDRTGNNPAELGSITRIYNYTPGLIPGKFGEALRFDGNTYAAVHTSPAIETPNDVTVDAWVNVPEIKNVSYNNILIEAVRTPTTVFPIRTLGLAVNGEAPSNASSPLLGALRGYVATSSGFSEIDTKQALPYNTWVHVVFVRSTTTGMHIYVDGIEQAVTIAAGTANPTGPILKPTDIYIGHDSMTEIDQLQISNTAEPLQQPLWMQWWLWTAIIFAGVAATGLVFHFKAFKSKGNQRASPASFEQTQ